MNYETTQPFQKKVKDVIESLFVIFFKYVKIFWGSQKILQKQAKHILKTALILEKGDSPPENSLRWRKEKSLKLKIWAWLLC